MPDYQLREAAQHVIDNWETGDLANAVRLLDKELTSARGPEPLQLVVRKWSDGTEIAVCPECGNSEFGYEEGVTEYRTPGTNKDGSVSVVWSIGAGGESGDCDPGLVCDNYGGYAKGCGKPVVLPEGWELEYD